MGFAESLRHRGTYSYQRDTGKRKEGLALFKNHRLVVCLFKAISKLFCLTHRREVLLKPKTDQCHSYITVQTLDPWRWMISRPHMNRFERLKRNIQFSFQVCPVLGYNRSCLCCCRYVRVCLQIHQTWTSFSNGTSFMEKEGRGRRHHSATSCKKMSREKTETFLSLILLIYINLCTESSLWIV